MTIYAEEHPPARPQFLTRRKAIPSGAIVEHTAQNRTDLVLPDDGAEGVASFISRRFGPGSYHEIIDSDSFVQYASYDWQCFGEGTGGNRWALHMSYACQADQWPDLPQSWVDGAIEIGGQRAANMARYIRATTGVIIPASKIDKAAYWAQQPGFIAHGAVDPGRRSDPGDHYPRAKFFEAYNQALSDGQDEEETRVLTLTEAMEDVGELYYAHLGRWPSEQERREWGNDLAGKIYAQDPVDPLATLQYINWQLEQQEASK